MYSSFILRLSLSQAGLTHVENLLRHKSYSRRAKRVKPIKASLISVSCMRLKRNLRKGNPMNALKYGSRKQNRSSNSLKSGWIKAY
jgi:hypothetical protein